MLGTTVILGGKPTWHCGKKIKYPRFKVKAPIVLGTENVKFWKEYNEAYEIWNKEIRDWAKKTKIGLEGSCKEHQGWK